MKYIVVMKSDVVGLTTSVNEFIEKGYVPQGGVCMYHTSGNLLQAMIKNE